MASRVLSIEIGITQTKVVEMDDKAVFPKVYQCFTFATPQGFINDGIVSADERFRNALREKLRERKIRTTKVIFIVNSVRIANREVTIPMVKENKIQSLLMANSSEYFPVDLTEYQLVYRVAEKLEQRDSKKLKLSVYAVPIKLIVSYQRLSAFLALSLKALDYVGNSVFQEMRKMTGKKQSVVLKIDEETSMLTIVENSQVALQRTMPYGVGKDKENSIAHITGNVSRVLDYYKGKGEGMPVEEVWVAGIGAQDPQIIQTLGSDLNVKTEILPVLSNIPVVKEAADDFHPADFIACVGAVLAPLPFSFKGSAFSKVESKFSNDSFVLPGIVCGLCVAASFALVAAGVLQHVNLKKDKSELEQSVAELRPVKDIYDAYTKTKAEYDDVTQMQAMTATPNDALLELLDELETNMPSTMRLTGMSADPTGVTFSVTTSDKEAAAKVIMELRNFKTLSSVSTSEVAETLSEDGTKLVTYIVACTYRQTSETQEDTEATTENSTESTTE